MNLMESLAGKRRPVTREIIVARSIAEACAWLADGVARMGAGAPKTASGAR